MIIPPLHEWTSDPAEARRIQAALVARVEQAPLPQAPRLVGGADVAFDRRRRRVLAAVLVFHAADMALVEEVTAEGPASFPYVPGLLTFREGPVMLEAFARLRRVPDVVLFDGQGIAHPRRLGLAAHMGLWLGLPTVGCAKSRLLGEHEMPGPCRGDATALLDGDEQIGEVLRTRDGVKPLFISPGHRADFPSARRIVLDCGRGCRLPEPTRCAHAAVTRYKREVLQA
ncbi:MAG: endonuclease V [Candidatus Brocadiaceae bacterium]|nr:endonuclease V [Candidatus Brocadiaceae bacterium]